MFDPTQIKAQFPILNRKINGNSLVYLDNAATTQKPQQVIDSITNYYSKHNANVHRGVHTLSEEATELYESARKATQSFLKAASEKEIIFTSGTTASINLVAYSLSSPDSPIKIQEGDEIIVSALEHHSNLVPWQELCKRTGAKLQIIPIKTSSAASTSSEAEQVSIELDLEAYKKLLSPKTKLVACTAMSNVLGAITPIKEIIELAKAQECPESPTGIPLTLIDAAQYASHFPINIQELNPDFLALSSHKMFGPTGFGILYMNSQIASSLPPFLFGGDMIKTVSQHSSEYAASPNKFEAGTPNIAGAIGFAEALKFITTTQSPETKKYEEELLQYAISKFSKYQNSTIYTSPKQASVLSFNLKNNSGQYIHPHDIASIFNHHAVAIRSGHHCAEPLMQTLQIPATARLSLHLYNSQKDLDQAEKALQKSIEIFS